MYARSCMEWGVSLDTLLSNIKFQHDFRHKFPEWFEPSGVIMFCGEQGSGKSLSAVRYIKALKAHYPSALIISNAKLNIGCDVIRYEGLEQLEQIDNAEKGIILFLDEMSSEFNSLGSKDIDISWFRIINMMRKRHLHVIGTCPVFSRISKAWREQFDCLVSCGSVTKYLQLNHVYKNNVDVLSEEDVKDGLHHDKMYCFFRSPEDFESYDTWEKVQIVEGVKKK